MISGIITTAICFLGMTMCVYHSRFWSRGKDRHSHALTWLFFTDFTIYGVTAAFGFWAMFHWSVDIAEVLHWVRHPIMVANILASWNLGYCYAAQGKGETG